MFIYINISVQPGPVPLGPALILKNIYFDVAEVEPARDLGSAAAPTEASGFPPRSSPSRSSAGDSRYPKLAAAIGHAVTSRV